LGQVELYESLAALEVPATDAPPEVWAQFSDRFRAVIEGQSALQRSRQLRTEGEKLAEVQKKQWATFDGEDFDALMAYLRGTRLFYDCLQLAYTPDRDGFEERILAPPA
jgi:hypothetical protein